MEVWLPIVGWEGFYEVSDHGQIRSVERIISHPYLGSQRIRERILKPFPVGQGYRGVTLIRNNVRHRVTVHTAVLTAFEGPCPPGLECRHLDGIRTNNARGNLCWGTRVENAADRRRHGTQTKGEFHPSATMTDAAVAALREARKVEGLTFRELGERFGCSKIHANRLVKGTRRSVAQSEPPVK